jgi:hypothetical protein
MSTFQKRATKRVRSMPWSHFGPMLTDKFNLAKQKKLSPDRAGYVCSRLKQGVIPA